MEERNAATQRRVLRERHVTNEHPTEESQIGLRKWKKRRLEKK